MIITKQFTVETSHIVRNAFSSRCRYNFHGHQGIFEVSIEGKIDPKDGMVLDFKRLEGIKKFIDMFDHCATLWEEESDDFKAFFKTQFQRVLIMKKNPTAENMVRLVAKFVSEWLPTGYSVAKVRYWETRTGSAEGNEFDDDDVFVFVSEDCKNG